eukprot:888274_1
MAQYNTNHTGTFWVCPNCSIRNSSSMSDCIACFYQQHAHGIQKTYTDAINMGFTEHYVHKAINLYESHHGRSVCPSADVIAEIIHRLQQADASLPKSVITKRATEIIISILTEHPILRKRDLHQQIQAKNNGVHWVDSFQKQLGSLKSFVSNNPRFDVQIDSGNSKSFTLCLATEPRDNDPDDHKIDTEQMGNDPVDHKIATEQRGNARGAMIRPDDHKIDLDTAETNITQVKLIGNRFFRQQNYKMAIECYSSGIEHNIFQTISLHKLHEHASLTELYQSLLSNRAKCFYHQKKLESALADTSKCIAVCDGSLLSYKARYTRSEILLHLRRYADAVTNCDLIINYNKEPSKSTICSLQERAKKLKLKIISLREEDMDHAKHVTNVLQDKCRTLESEKQKLMSENVETKKQLQKSIDQLQEEKVVLSDRLKLFNGTSQKMNTLGFEALDELESKLHNGILKIQNSRNALLDRKFSCVVCLDAPKNILTDGCNHIVLCQVCETKLLSKVCPMCQRPYKTV